MINQDFYKVLEVIASERGLEMPDILGKVQIALAKACATEGFTGEIVVDFNNEAKKIKIIEYKTVVSELDPEKETGEITLEDAKEIKANSKIGTVLRKEISIKNDIGRKGAMQFKQLLTQGLKELTRQKGFEFFKERENEMITVTVAKVTEDAVFFSLGFDVDAYMPIKEALNGEQFEVGTKTKVYITAVEETSRGPKVYVSRVHKGIVKRLFENIIPEIQSGAVEIMNIARDAGSRTKIGVYSENPTVDAKGACVGMKGSRIKQINDALNGERVDVFIWNSDPVKLIAEALTPAQVLAVLVNEAEKKSIVIVPDSQFSLAIGKGGQNARLASQVTGWKIDIKDETTAYREEIKFKPNLQL